MLVSKKPGVPNRNTNHPNTNTNQSNASANQPNARQNASQWNIVHVGYARVGYPNFSGFSVEYGLKIFGRNVIIIKYYPYLDFE